MKGVSVSQLMYGELDNAGAIVLRQNDGIVDIFVHYSDNGYKVYVEKGGRFEVVSVSASELAQQLRPHIPDGHVIRLNSCSDLKSARAFSKEFPNHRVYATESYVRVHQDGGITAIARSGNDTQKWYKLEKGEIAGDAPKPKLPEGEAAGRYLRMGDFDAGFATKLERYNELLEIKRDCFLEKRDFKGQDELNKLYDNISEFENIINIKCKGMPNISVKDHSLQNTVIYYWAEVVLKENKIIGLKNGYYDIVLTIDGDLRFGRGHYHLSGDADFVKGAGGVVIQDGKITTLNNSSGHYRPTHDDCKRLSKLLRDLGITNYNKYHAFDD